MYCSQCKTDRAPTVSIGIDFMKKIGALAKPGKFCHWVRKSIDLYWCEAIAYFSLHYFKKRDALFCRKMLDQSTSFF